MPQIIEWSANFDTATLDQLLKRVVSVTNEVVTEDHQRQIMDFVRSLEHNDEKPISFEIQHKGERTSLGLTVFMDDIDAPDVAFFAPPEIIAIIKSEYEKLCEELGL